MDTYYFVVRIAACVPEAQLDHDDRTEQVPGNYAFRLKLSDTPADLIALHVERGNLSEADHPSFDDALLESGLDYFHDHVAIARLDDFCIEIERVAGPEEFLSDAWEL